MASQREKKSAVQYITDRLEDSGLYLVQTQSPFGVEVISKNSGKKAEVLIPNFLGPVRRFNEEYRANIREETHTVPILYKDRKTAFVRMADRNLSLRAEKSLKRYSLKDINSMLHLRAIEKIVLGLNSGGTLFYMQPESDRLPEALVEFGLGDVTLDYSHISQDDRRFDFVEDRTSIDYKLPTKVGNLGPAIRIMERPGRALIAQAQSTEIGDDFDLENFIEKCARENRETARSIFPDFSEDEALAALHGTY